MVQEIQFGFKRPHNCDVEGCPLKAFIQCAHCRKYLCLDHFLERVCFHSENVTIQARPRTHDDHDRSDGSAGAAVAITIVAVGAGTAVVGTGATGAAGSSGIVSAVSGATATGTSLVGSLVDRAKNRLNSRNEHDERIPLIPLEKSARLEEVFVDEPSPGEIALLIRD